ncbi:acyltransferase family protein [Brevundimonas viscosa]|uniref:Peptidoglycan/LPS O-acetylase OafA/YrhL, contains acyltransferase and SGNH-hydrolase domains n=1 Tax=Brevundimonas viscosa TaxID=871741 RepID=A0A1I6NW80_9CAUL|nr:acyltransferase [Brevundimonas viscosa]SFS32191.1 Peptidoglycan/LPS O-acetylase OafA/YrhL, contains acyltransferase and SGNH-hydrolase domains [Brevundimonas viscosa]
MTPVATPPDLRALTTLRFLAAAWVVLYTAWAYLDVGSVPVAVTKGYLGVEVFFVLSGFILSHVYLERAGAGGFSYGGFLWARIARVYPLHLVTLFAMVGLGIAATLAGVLVDASLTDWRALPAHLTMTHAWGLAPLAAFNHPSWSISAEWFAYLSFPAFAFVAWRLRDRPWLAVGLTALGALGVYAAFERLAGFPLTEATFRWGALRIVPCFALGCALYLVYRKAPLRRAALVALASAAGLLASASLALWDPVTVLFAGGLILGLGSLANERAGPLASAAGVYLGEISYSIYMVCAPVLLVMTNLAARALGADEKRFHVFVWLGILAAIPVAAMATYHLVERPARKALRGFAARKRPGQAGAPATADSPERVLQPSKTIV